MASSQSLLGLVNQLQSLELTFTTILMESAMKLSALTDANIFVLVESQEGRKYCGKRHLCDAYAGSGLSPIGNDVEMEVNPGITSIQERRIGPPPPFRSPPSSNPRAKPASPLTASLENIPGHGRAVRKRPSGQPAASLPAKQPRHHHQPFSQLQQEQQQQQQQQQDSSQQASQRRQQLEKDDHVIVVDVKQEASPCVEVDPNGNTIGGGGGGGGAADGSRKSLLDSDDSDSAEIVEEVPSSREELPLSCIEKALNRMTNEGGNQQSGQEVLSSGGFDDLSDVSWQPTTGSPALYQNDSCTDLSASEQDQVYERFLSRIAEDGRRKIEAIQSFGEDKILFLKGSAPQKILSSLCYTLGKAVTEECIEYGQVDPKSHFPKQLFVILIDRFLLDHFPQLIHAYAKLRHEIKKTFFSVLNKAKNKAVFASPLAACR